MIRLPLKCRIKRIIRNPLIKLFCRLSRNQSTLLKIGFIEKLRRKFAPTIEEQRQDIIVSHGENVNACVRDLLYFESTVRKIMPPDPIP